MKYQLKTIECVNALLNDLYINLRKKVNYWSKLTGQTAQAKMGYIGQHLVSAVTGYLGGKSGARGKDLIISDTEYAEIKTCTRIDQLGVCKNCGSPVSPVEERCSLCNSTNIKRKDDSKWLINITEEEPNENTLDDSEDVLTNIIKPKYFFFVLFEYEDIGNKNSPVIITIYRVNPRNPGFVFCMLDYFYKLGHKSAFNMWPHMLKFALCHPCILYKSKIENDGRIETLIFEPDNPQEVIFDDLPRFSQSKLVKDNSAGILSEYGIDANDGISVTKMLKVIDEYCKENNISNETKINKFSKGLYKSSVSSIKSDLNAKGRRLPSVFDEFVDSLD